ncbi:MAG: AAA family ATPase [Spiroplasma poulsonii]|uniref:Endonuclease GajA/Old nuclease/RecF-like AAA domain-containing protein n=1 Tax=Spiroplasma poulsonii TaxID=2138 RepID=A0A2P6FCI3_9MOLU|nr:AAA family ATPase [Spiroplasma poulsonii]KAF0851500.1 hypothetical protein MSROBK_009280 [Spiroplasma poulsonii]MBW1241569.1 AAA family ATPase [Spiroplasma poulsonii]PQM31094.1 hypothetical protein SMSRO_SF008930 [Spiroplasma poulsonii]PWF96093.1 hypothetical protein SMSE_15310 [Spiroplasma poulsonii]PWF98867.1 hypothetical protein SMH99_14300 [Spiroplasma poulsonii]
MKKGTLNIYVGPNGCGKSYLLEQEKKEQENSILIPTEIVWENDFKESTKNNTTSMDIIINELLLPSLTEEINTFNNVVNAKASEINSKLKDKNIISNIKRYIPILKTDNLIKNDTNYKITLSKLLNLDTTLIKEMSSGMGTYLIINLLKLSNKTDIYIDEPEKFCHPSLITIIAKEINKLVANGKNITITTHSPKLIKELNWDFDNLFIINTHNKDLEKQKINLNIEKIVNNSEIKNLSKLLKDNGSPDQGYKIIGEYLSSEEKLKKYLQLRRKNFIDMFFAKNIY